MYELLVFMLTFVAVTSLGAGLVVGLTARGRVIRSRLQEAPSAVAAVRASGSEANDRGVAARALARIGRGVSSGGASQRLRQELAQAGYHGSGAASVYIGAKLLLALLGVMVAPLLWAIEVRPAYIGLGTVAAAGLLMFVPNVIVSVQRGRRREEVRNHLPDAIDLLEICVSSGMGLDMAWNVVSDEIRRVSPTLADEMALTNLEMHLGAPRVEAMRHLAGRTGVDEINSMVAVLVQSDRFGTSVADALRTFAESMREFRSLRAQESAEKMAVRLLFPMVLLIFPALLIVMVGPAGMKIAEMIAD